jgi:hypothetical protein
VSASTRGSLIAVTPLLKSAHSQLMRSPAAKYAGDSSWCVQSESLTLVHSGSTPASASSPLTLKRVSRLTLRPVRRNSRVTSVGCPKAHVIRTPNEEPAASDSSR